MSKKGSSLIREKGMYRIGEVASFTQIEPHVLRYWETEFPGLRPHKSPHGQRLYRQSDIQTVLSIKRLLYEQGFTIAGARKQLEDGNGHPNTVSRPNPSAAAAATGSTEREQLLSIRAELERLLTLLSRR